MLSVQNSITYNATILNKPYTDTGVPPRVLVGKPEEKTEAQTGVLKWIFKEKDWGADWTDLAQETNNWRVGTLREF